MQNHQSLFARYLKTSTIVALSVLFVAACSEQQEAQIAPPASAVQVAKVITAEIVSSHEFTGRTHAPETVDLRPRVSGYIASVDFVEGSKVEQGDVLFTIDAAPFAAELSRLNAELNMAQDQLSLAEAEYKRAKKLGASAAISAEVLDQRLSTQQQAQARVQAVKAALRLAELELSYTQIKAPIAGKISNATITQGNYVHAGQSSLTRIVSTAKIHAYFDADEVTYLNYAKAQNTGRKNPILMGLANQEDLPFNGQIDFIDNQVNPKTGTIRARASFENTSGELIPGLFTRLQVISDEAHVGVLIDDKAIATDLNNKYVLVLDENNHVQYRAVTLGSKLAGLRVIESGLLGNEEIVISGLQRVRPGAPVDPTHVDMANAESQAALTRYSNRIAKLLEQNTDKLASN
jgi:multidrug efflux system membrane fusion protein